MVCGGWWFGSWLLFAEDWSRLGPDGEHRAVGHRVDWSVGDCVDRAVSNSVDRCGIGGRSVGLLHMGHSLVLHVGDEPVLVVRVVGHNLHTAVGKLNAVFSWEGFVQC